MSLTSLQRSAEFLKIADQFKLGALTTESSHPVTANLGEVARHDAAAGLKLLFEVDDDVVRKYRDFSESGRARRLADAVLPALRAGGNLYFTGCGSTGRLSILLASMWRDFWQRIGPPAATVFEDRVFPVMAGGDYALIKAVEGFEDYADFGRKQLRDLGVNSKDVVFAITEGGETSFVIGTAWEGVAAGAKVYFVYNNPDEVLCEHVQRSREVILDPRIEKLNLTTGPMGITGSTRMQATSIQLAVLATILEMVVRELAGRSDAGEVPRRFLAELTAVHASLQAPELRAQLAALTMQEECVYRAGHRNNYFAGLAGIDLLTDTTERSPTFCTPPFRKFDDPKATESWAFLFVSASDSAGAWEAICCRKPHCIEWRPEEVRGLVPEDRYERTVETIGRISYAELMRFRIGRDGLPSRPPAVGTAAVALILEAEMAGLLAPDGFHRTQLEQAVQAGARAGLIFVGGEAACREARRFVSRWNSDCAGVYLTVPDTGLLLSGAMRVGLKMLLNALSTCTMVRLGRVMGNYMIWVVPSNLKLIDRATRYVQKLTGLDYESANQLLFEVIEYVEPRMKADQAYPPVVGLSVLRHRHGLGNEEAERDLMAELNRF